MTSNNIELQIQGAIGRFIADTGSEPKAILLGPMEYLALEYGLRARVSIYLQSAERIRRGRDVIHGL
jgi:hypothetical protein